MAQRIKLLVIDDERTLLNGLRRSVPEELFDLRTATIIDEALWHTADGWAPDAVLSDYALGADNGGEVLMEFKRRYPTARLLMMTGSRDLICPEHLSVPEEIFDKPFARLEALWTEIHQLLTSPRQ